MINKTKQELLQLHLKSILYFREEDVHRPPYGCKGLSMGSLIICDWYLSKNQLNFIRIRKMKREFQNDIKLCLDEVNLFFF